MAENLLTVGTPEGNAETPGGNDGTSNGGASADNAAPGASAESNASDWAQSLPESLRSYAGQAKDLAGLEDAVKRGLAHTPVGKVEDIEITPPDGVDMGDMDWFKQVAVEQGFSKGQIDALIKGYGAQVSAMPELMRQAAEKDLRAAFGQDYDKKIAVAKDAAKRLDEMSNGAFKPLVELGLGNHPAFVKAMVTIGEAISDSALPGGNNGAGDSAVSTEQFITDVFKQKA
jgi:hypothetical protein